MKLRQTDVWSVIYAVTFRCRNTACWIGFPQLLGGDGATLIVNHPKCSQHDAIECGIGCVAPPHTIASTFILITERVIINPIHVVFVIGENENILTDVR